MKKIFMILLLSTISMVALGQEYLVRVWDKTCWTDGWRKYEAMSDGNDHVTFDWNTANDSGYAFSLTPEDFAKQEYSVHPYSDENNVLDINAKEGDVAVVKTFGTTKYIVLKDKDGNVTEIIRRLNSDNDYDKALHNSYAIQFTGDYTDKSGRMMKMTAETITLPGICKDAKYTFGTRDFMPIEFVCISATGKCYCLEHDIEGMKVYAAKKSHPEGYDYEEFTTYEKGKLLFTLRPNTTKRRWPSLSTTLLTRGMLTDMSKQELRLMRNEIFAAHGYKFSSDDLKAYFKEQKWYRPIGNNAAMKLNEIETLNVSLLNTMEGKK